MPFVFAFFLRAAIAENGSSRSARSTMTRPTERGSALAASWSDLSMNTPVACADFSVCSILVLQNRSSTRTRTVGFMGALLGRQLEPEIPERSEEHTSELQSR